MCVVSRDLPVLEYLGILYFSAVSVKNFRNNINTNFRKYEILFQRIARARGGARWRAARFIQPSDYYLLRT
jgi:hypothetical protein